MILGMGKLGGKELNHSSDVDLIFIHDDLAPVEQQDQSNRHRIKVARSLIDVMSDLTEEGFLAGSTCGFAGGDRAPSSSLWMKWSLLFSQRRIVGTAGFDQGRPLLAVRGQKNPLNR